MKDDDWSKPVLVRSWPGCQSEWSELKGCYQNIRPVLYRDEPLINFNTPFCGAGSFGRLSKLFISYDQEAYGYNGAYSGRDSLHPVSGLKTVSLISLVFMFASIPVAYLRIGGSAWLSVSGWIGALLFAIGLLGLLASARADYFGAWWM